VNIFGAQWEPVPGTNGKVNIPLSGTLDAQFHEQGRTSKWPDLISGDAGHYSIFLFSKDLAKEISVTGFSGIDFHPVNFELGNLKGLKGKGSKRPEYVWGRVWGIAYVDLYLGDRKVPLDVQGRFPMEKCPLGQLWRIKPRPDQPDAKDFSRIIPGALFNPVVTPRVADYFDSMNLKEARISAVGNGWL
jgi:hypothetical protein